MTLSIHVPLSNYRRMNIDFSFSTILCVLFFFSILSRKCQFRRSAFQESVNSGPLMLINSCWASGNVSLLLSHYLKIMSSYYLRYKILHSNRNSKKLHLNRNSIALYNYYMSIHIIIVLLYLFI